MKNKGADVRRYIWDFFEKSGYKEYTDYIGIKIAFPADGSFKINFDSSNNRIILANVIIIDHIINKIYKIIKSKHGGNLVTQNATALQVPVIDIPALRSVAGRSFDSIDVAGTFLVQIKENFKNITNELQARERLEFEKGIEDYGKYISVRAEESIKFSEEKIAEEKARTNEAINAEATADTAEDLQEATAYWVRKLNRHSRSRKFWFAAFIVLIVISMGILLVKIYFSPPPELRPDASATEAIAVYLRNYFLPILAVAWILRLISRQFITHLVLEEDAELRHTLVLTFLALKQNGNQEMAEKERAHMLEAIFRPLPVTPSSDVNQPTFADIAKMPR